MTGKTDKPRQVAVIGHAHPSGLNMAALVAGLEPYQRAALVGMSGHALHRLITEQVAMANGSTITLHPAPDVDAIRGLELEFIAMDELDPTPPVETDPAGPPPRALSNTPTHKDFHPSYMRVGLRINGNEATNVKWYDMDMGRFSTTDGRMFKSDQIEPYWRFTESRQMRRARERWEGKHKGRGA